MQEASRHKQLRQISTSEEWIKGARQIYNKKESFWYEYSFFGQIADSSAALNVSLRLPSRTEPVEIRRGESASIARLKPYRSGSSHRIAISAEESITINQAIPVHHNR
jgi:hypothetical protein